MEKPILSTLAARKMTVLALLFIIYSLLIGNCFSQPSITWQRLYNGPYNADDYASAICEVTSGKFVVAGYTRDSLYVLKINELGDTLWTKIYNYGLPEAIVSSGDGGCVIAGWNYVTKLDSNGTSVWYNDSVGRLNDIIRISGNEFIACGEINVFNGYFVKINSFGTIQWQKTYFSGYSRNYSSIVLGNDGNYLAGGVSIENIAMPSTVLLTKINDSGNIIWEKKHSIVNNRYASIKAVMVTNNGYAIAGTTENNSNPPKNNAFFARINDSGDINYSKVFYADSTQYLTSCKKRSDSKFIYTLYDAREQINDSVTNKFVIIDSLGSIVAQKKIVSADDVDFESLVPLTNGDLVFAGSIDFFKVGGNQDIYIIRTDSMLNYPSNIYGIEPLNNEIPQKFKLHQNYPNPFNPITRIRFELPENSFINLKLYDILGKEIATLLDQELRSGIYEIKVSSDKLTSGIYFYQIISSKYTVTKKMIILK